MSQKRMECFRLLLEHIAWIEHQFLSSIRDSRKARGLWGMMRGVRRVRKSINQSWLAKGLGLGLLCWGFKGVQEEIPSEEASTLQIGSVAFPPGQYTSPQLHPCHRLFEQDGHQDSCLPSLSSRPYSLLLSVISWAQRLSLWDNLGDERGCDEGHRHTHTRGLHGALQKLLEGTTSALQPEEITSNGTRVLCMYNKNISAHTKKVWKLIWLSSNIYIYIYI